MYQELQIFEESFNGPPVWGIEGDDVPWPTLAVGDLFEYASLPNIHWRTPPALSQAFKVVAIKHVFTESTKLGPSADHVLQVAVALDDFAQKQEMALEEADAALQNQICRGNFLTTLLTDLAQRAAPNLQRQLVQGIVSNMKMMPAYDVEDEAATTWEEAAIVLQADGHELAEALRGSIRSDVSRAIKDLCREDRLTLWLADVQINDWFSDDWPNAARAFDPQTHWNGAMDSAEEQLVKRILLLLHAHQLPT